MSVATHHGQLYLRDQIPQRSVYFASGRFGRLFPSLPPFFSSIRNVQPLLCELGKPQGVMDADDPPFDRNHPIQHNARNPDSINPGMTAGMTFLGQFLDHDITFDPTSSLERQSDPESIANFRTPAFELDSVYGSGRAASPQLYDRHTSKTKFLIDSDAPWDLPRNSQNIAIIGDPRNDENTIVSQLQLAFLKFHNAVIDDLGTAGDPNSRFDKAQQLVRWHYQGIILHQFLPLTVGQDLVDRILNSDCKCNEGRRYYDWRNEPFIPVEFSVAAYRFGHSQVRPSYCINKRFAAPLFDPTLPPNSADPLDLRGGVRAPRRVVDWDIFFDLGRGLTRRNKRIDTTISSPLMRLPFAQPGTPGDGPMSLARRNLLRHVTFSLPSGQDVARLMGEDPLTPEQIGLAGDLEVFNESTPLWFYILREACCLGEKGNRLGPVGGRIVAEVFIGLLYGDRNSFLRRHPKWTPKYGTAGNFTMSDMLRFAGVGDAPVIPDHDDEVPCRLPKTPPPDPEPGCPGPSKPGKRIKASKLCPD